LTKLFDGRDVASCEEARQVFLASKNDPRALRFDGVLVADFDEIRRAADLGDALAQAEMTMRTVGKESFRWAEKSAAQGERDGLYWLGRCFRDGIGCEEDKERAKEYFCCR
jgi:TPR repeat protein